jgi:hypothetical protein
MKQLSLTKARAKLSRLVAEVQKGQELGTMSADTIRRWRAELGRAMIRVGPEFFSWSTQDAERYRMNLPEKDRRRMDQALMKELFGARIRSWKSDKLGNKRIPLRHLNHWNEAILPLVGIGEDYFYLNESPADGQTILDFVTLRDYDEGDYSYQETARKHQDGRAPKIFLRPYFYGLSEYQR